MSLELFYSQRSQDSHSICDFMGPNGSQEGGWARTMKKQASIRKRATKLKQELRIELTLRQTQHMTKYSVNSESANSRTAFGYFQSLPCSCSQTFSKYLNFPKSRKQHPQNSVTYFYLFSFSRILSHGRKLDLKCDHK